MRAQLLPLKGKYYGTMVQIAHDNGDLSLVKFWLEGEMIPSIRECDLHDLDDPDNPDWDLIDSSHYENADSYCAAVTFIKAINKKN